MNMQAERAASEAGDQEALLVLESEDPGATVRVFVRIGAVMVPGLFVLFWRDEGLVPAAGAALGLSVVLLGLLVFLQAHPTRIAVERSCLRLTRYRFGRAVETQHAWSDLEATKLSAATVPGTEQIILRWRNAGRIKLRVAFYRYGEYGAVFRVALNRTPIDWEQELSAHRYPETLRRLMAERVAEQKAGSADPPE
jgi:hypothetical protein